MNKTLNPKQLRYLIPALLLATITSCKKDHPVTIEPIGKYENGFFIVNEGNYGHDHGGTITYFDYKTTTLTDSVYTKENTVNAFDPNTSSLEFGTVFNHRLYLLTKSGGPLVVADANSLKETGRIAAAASNDWRALLPLDNNNALVSTVDGIYPLNLQTITLGTKLTTVSGEVGDMIKAGNYIFVLSATDGVVALKASDYSVAKKFPGLVTGFAKTLDGGIYAAGGATLVRINPNDLSATTVTLPFSINGSWGAWHAGSIVASTTENAIFLLKDQPYEGGNEIYKYTSSNANSFATPFITTPAGTETYGKGLGFDAKTNQLVVTTVHTGYDFNDNDLILYNSTSGTVVKDITFTGNYFPAEPVLH